MGGEQRLRARIAEAMSGDKDLESRALRAELLLKTGGDEGATTNALDIAEEAANSGATRLTKRMLAEVERIDENGKTTERVAEIRSMLT